MDAPVKNVDMLAWFSDDERHQCAKCGRRAVVTLPEALASFCLSCGTIWIDGKAIEITAELEVVAHKNDAPPAE